MPKNLNLPAQDITPGVYVYEIDTPTRCSKARTVITREATAYPEGALFSFQAFERERGGTLIPLTGGTVYAGTGAPGPNGVVPEILDMVLSWSPDKDKDVIRIEATVLQTFHSAIRLDFVD